MLQKDFNRAQGFAQLKACGILYSELAGYLAIRLNI